MNRYHLVHVTEFAYESPVSESYNELRLRPRDDDSQNCSLFRLTTQPPSRPAQSLDRYGNYVHRFNVLPEHKGLRITAESVVRVSDPPELENPVFLLELLSQTTSIYEEHYDLLIPSSYVPHPEEVVELMREARRRARGNAWQFARAACDLVHSRFRYQKGATHVHSSVLDFLRTGAGVCQDYSHCLLAVLRACGLPARYVSGYLAPKKAADAPVASLEEVVGGRSSHAWVEVFIPGSGWAGLDPTVGKPVGVQHIRVAYGRDYGDVAPVRGVYKGSAGQILSVDVRVRAAVDLDGEEHVTESAAPAAPAPREDALPQQRQQQQ